MPNVFTPIMSVHDQAGRRIDCYTRGQLDAALALGFVLACALGAMVTTAILLWGDR